MVYGKQLFKQIAFLALVLLTILLIVNKAYSAETLFISASLSKESYNAGESIKIDGIVKDGLGNPVSGASISIQVDGPSGVIHLALVYSAQDGTFTHEFKIPQNADAGTYIIHLTASKQGYSDATTQISCLVVAEFNGLIVTFLSLTVALILVTAFKKRNKKL
jgi:uncharacterized membrane protein